MRLDTIECFLFSCLKLIPLVRLGSRRRTHPLSMLGEVPTVDSNLVRKQSQRSKNTAMTGTFLALDPPLVGMSQHAKLCPMLRRAAASQRMTAILRHRLTLIQTTYKPSQMFCRQQLPRSSDLLPRVMKMK